MMNETTWWLIGISAIWAVACYNWYRLGLRRGRRVASQIPYVITPNHPWVVRDLSGRHLEHRVESEARAREMARHYQAQDPGAKWVVREVGE